MVKKPCPASAAEKAVAALKVTLENPAPASSQCSSIRPDPQRIAVGRIALRFGSALCQGLDLFSSRELAGRRMTIRSSLPKVPGGHRKNAQ
jgi:hypothetical protein